MASEITKLYEFGKFRFDVSRLRLEFDGAPVQLPQKSLEVLKVLLELRGETVTRENLIEKVWTDTIVEDANLSVAVSTLRKTLAVHDGDGETFIRTVPRQGYRFVADAAEIAQAADTIVVERHTVERITIEQTARQRFSRTWSAAAAILIFAGATLGLGFWLTRGQHVAAIGDFDRAKIAFAKGGELLEQRKVCQSIPRFREAVAENPNFAPAHANLAASLAMCGDPDGESERLSARALELDPNSADAHAVDGFIKMFRHWDWTGAEAALRRAVALNPTSVKAHHWLAVNLSIRGRLQEATHGEMARAIELDPNSALLHADLCQILYFAQNYSSALNSCRKARELDENLFLTPKYQRDIHLVTGDEQAAIGQELEWMSHTPQLAEDYQWTKDNLEREGFKTTARKAIERLSRDFQTEAAKGDDLRRFKEIALDYYVTLGDKENTLVCLETIINCDGDNGCVRSFWLPYIAVDPRYNFLRGDARFQTLIRKMNLAD